MFLETSFLVDRLREVKRAQPGPASQKLESLKETEVMVSVFTLCELRAGAELSDHRREELERVTQIVESLTVIYPDSSFPALYGEILADLTRRGTPIPAMDLLLAVQAKRFGVPVLTRDVQHFSKIPGLEIVTY